MNSFCCWTIGLRWSRLLPCYRRLLLGILLIVVASLCASAVTTAGRGDWWLFRHDLQHTGRSHFTGVSVPALKWTHPCYLGGGTGILISSPALGADGTLYVGSADQHLYAVNPDGTAKWAHPFATNGYILSSPAIGTDGVVYVGSADGKLYAINPDGTMKWQFSAGSEIDSSPTLGTDGTIYVGCCNHALYAINPNGTRKWAFTTGAAIYSSPAIGTDGTIYVGSCDDKLYAINANGTAKWTHPFATSDEIASSPAVGTDGTIYLGSADHHLYAINSNGVAKWAHPVTTTQPIISSPAIGADGTIYIGSEDGSVYAVTSSGTIKWIHAGVAGDSILWSSPAIGTDGVIYVGSVQSRLYAINANGTAKWTYTFNAGEINASPIIGADGTLYAVATNGYLFALGTPPPPPATFQPDLGICNNGESAYLGLGTLNLTGAGQTKSQTVATGVTATYLFEVKNAGNTGDSFTLTCSSLDTAWKVQFVDRGTGQDVTAAVIGKGGKTITIAAGSAALYLLHVTPLATASAVKPLPLLITATSSSDKTKQDAVKAITTKQ